MQAPEHVHDEPHEGVRVVDGGRAAAGHSHARVLERREHALHAVGRGDRVAALENEDVCLCRLEEEVDGGRLALAPSPV